MAKFSAVVFSIALISCCACETAKKIGGGCADVVTAAASGRPADIISACRSIGNVVTDPGVQKDIQKIEKKCEENPDGGSQAPSTPEEQMLNAMLTGASSKETAAVASNLQKKLDQACSDCAAAASICASYGEPLPSQMDDLAGACCEVVAAS